MGLKLRHSFVVLSILMPVYVYSGNHFSSLNLRYKSIQQLTVNYNLIFSSIKYEASDYTHRFLPLNLQAGVGSGGINIGVGFGFAGSPDGPVKGPIQPLGLAARMQVFKPWKPVLFGNEKASFDYDAIYLGMDLTVAIFLGLDIGYYVPADLHFKDSYFSLGIGIGF